MWKFHQSLEVQHRGEFLQQQLHLHRGSCARACSWDKSCVQMAILYRQIREDDFAEMKELHEALFPVKYSDSFFRDIVAGRAVRGGLQLFSSLAVKKIHEKEEIVGFILAQTMSISSCDDVNGIFESTDEPNQVCYILTLGLRRDQRRSGIGSILLQQCVEFSSQIPECGVVCNFSRSSLKSPRSIFMSSPTISLVGGFMKRIPFFMQSIIRVTLRSFPPLTIRADFYTINGRRYSSETYAKYLNGFHPPFTLQFYEFFSSHSLYFLDTLRWIEYRLFGSNDLVTWLTSSNVSVERDEGGKEDYPYMDDIVLPPPEPSKMDLSPPYPPPISTGSDNI